MLPTGFALDGEVEDYAVFVTAPIDIALLSFSAHPVAEGVKIIWQAASEVDHAGYNIYRSLRREGEYKKLNWSLITSESASSPGANSYEFIDNESPVSSVFYKLEDVSLDGRSAWCDPIQVSITADVEAANEIPREFDLKSNYPNPFNSATTIAYSLPERSTMVLTIYDAQGKLIRTLVSGLQPAGHHSVTWDGTNDAGQLVASGLFIYRMTAGDFHKVGRMTLLK